jgi:hypothetical protein
LSTLEEREKQRAYMREYRKTYLPRKRELAKSARLAKKDNYLRQERDYRSSHAAQIASKYREWASANRDRVKESKARYRAKKRDELREKNRAYQKANPGKVSARAMRRHAARLKATPAWSDPQAIAAIYDECARINRETGVRHQVDHIIPLRSDRVCGLHVAHNLQILTATENRHKSNNLQHAA